MKKSRIFMALILSMLFVFTAGAVVLDTAEADAVLSADTSDYGELVFSVDFEGMTSITNGGVITQTSESFGSQNVLIYSRGMNMTYGLGTPVSGESQMLSMAATDYHGCVGFQSYSLDKPGIYTLTYDRYYANSVAYQSCAINAAPSTAQVVHSAKTIENVQTSVTLNEGDTAITYVAIQFAKYQSGTADSPVYIDNVKLYYKNNNVYGTAMFMYGDGDFDEITSVPSVTSGMTLEVPTQADLEAFTQVPNGYYFAGFTRGDSFVAAGSSYVVTDADIAEGTFCFYPVFKKIPDDIYGELVFCEDFDGMSGAVANSGYLASLMMGTYDGKKVQIYDRAAGCYYEIAAPITENDNMLSVSGGNYPQISLLNLGLSEPGTYTVVYDYYFAEDTAVSFMQSGFNNSTSRISVIRGNVQTVAAQKTIVSGETISSFDIQTGFTDPAFYIDNIRIYYMSVPAPTAIDANSIRTSGYAGIRFISFASNALRSKADEYGYIVTAKKDSISDYEAALVFADGERTAGEVAVNEYGVAYTIGVNFVKDKTDVVYSENGDFLPSDKSLGDDGVYFTAVMTNIPESQYARTLVVRPYAVVDGTVYYGNVVSKSIYEVAVELKNSEGYVENAYIENIIDTVENA